MTEHKSLCETCDKCKTCEKSDKGFSNIVRTTICHNYEKRNSV